MKYAPEKHYEDEELDNRVYDEMATGDWWWETQVSTCIQTLVSSVSERSFAEFGATRVNFPLVQRYRQLMFPQIRQTCLNLLVINKGGQYILPLETSARTHDKSSQNMQLFCLGTFRSQSSNVSMRRIMQCRDIPSFTNA